jgi:hypothetical protein
MAFKKANFATFGSGKRGIGGAPAIHSYKTDDAITVVDGAGYFNSIRTLLSIGDIIFVIVVTNLDASNEALADASIIVVKDKSTTAVDCTDETALTITDSD